MRLALSGLCLTTAALLISCSGASAPLLTPDNDTLASTSALPMPWETVNGVHTFNPGIQTLSIDADALTAAITPKTRYAAFNGDLFYLNINQFAGGFPAQVVGILINGDGDLELTWEVKHPFPAPTQLTTASAGNRADLGVSGRVVFLLGVDTTTLSVSNADPDYVGNYAFSFDTQNVRMQTGLLLNPAGFYDPAGMVPLADRPAGNATHYPFQQLVDEMATDGVNVVGSRVGISNGGLSTGNYDSNNGGWQNGNMGPSFNGWTGYGVLHQGQRSRGVAIFDLDALSGTLDLDIAVIATYVDPRDGGGPAVLRSNRIPKNDPSKFAYRMPHGAVDIERVTQVTPSPFTPSTTGALVYAQIIDQDNQALIDPEFPGQGGIRLDEIPTASGIEAAFASSDEFGFNNVAGLNQLGAGSGEAPVDFLFSFDNISGTDGGYDAAAYVCYKVVDVQRQADEGFTLNNNNPPTPVASGQEQTPIVFQVAKIDITP